MIGQNFYVVALKIEEYVNNSFENQLLCFSLEKNHNFFYEKLDIFLVCSIDGKEELPNHFKIVFGENCIFPFDFFMINFSNITK